MKNYTLNFISYAKKYYDKKYLLPGNIETLWDILQEVAKDPSAGTIICVLDGLDECEELQLRELTKKLKDFYSSEELADSGCLKILLTSRPYQRITIPFENLDRGRCFFVDGEQMSSMLTSEIELVMKENLKPIAARFGDAWAHKLEKKIVYGRCERSNFPLGRSSL